MQTSLFTGISGLNANLAELSVVGNNIANVNTVGFKTSRAMFSDLLSQTLNAGGSPKQIGLGVDMTGVEKLFNQGAMETTGNAFDLAISGGGFFVLQDPGLNKPSYSRAGQFHTDKDNYLVNPDNLRLQGFLANSSGVLGNTVQDIQLTTNNVAPNSTSKVDISVNLDSNAPVTGYVFTSGTNDTLVFDVGGAPITASLVTDGGLVTGTANDGGSVAAAIKSALEAKNGTTDTYSVGYDGKTGKYTVTNETGNGTTLTLDWSTSTSATLLGYNAVSSGPIAAGASDTSDLAGGAFTLAKAGETSNFSAPVTIYDTLGNSHVITTYFRKNTVGTSGNTWDWYSVVDAADSTSGSSEVQANGSMTFDTTGALFSESAVTYPTGGFDFAGGVNQNQIIAFDFGTGITAGGTGTDGTTQYGVGSSLLSLKQDGFAPGTLQRLDVGTDGLITGVFSNGTNRSIARIMLADFPNLTGLSSAGSGLFSETSSSGQRLLNAPGSGGVGMLRASTLELSTVDIAQEFVKMITAQRGFQANSRIITTTDALLAELVNLKR
ncbi:MAG: flagellar hook protein FlgE [Thermodesulfobacteriota bacterium]